MSSQNTNKSVHAGHRERVRENVLKNGFEQLEDHKLLELLLFYSIPREDTNELAHRLLNEFHSLSGVIKASPKQLQKVIGVGDNTAVLISAMGELCVRVLKEGNIKKTPYLNYEDLLNLIKSHYISESKERFLLVCLDSGFRLKLVEFISEGDSVSVDFDIKKLVTKVLECDASIVVIAHNHPNGNSTPSGSDVDVTASISVMLRKMNISLFDHIIIGEDNHYSMRKQPEFSNLFDN
ncbi:MAG: DNA repair protein RadC [Clostridia bacterium]|nr:DNA repair protein RadC [Clostridia bacterium]